MKKAKVVLAVTALLAVVGGVFAAKAKYTPHILWTYTIYTTVNGRTCYSITGPFCTVTNRFATTLNTIIPAATLYTTGPATGTFSLFCTNQTVITFPEFECVPTITRITIFM